MSLKHPTITVFEGEDGWHYHLQARNGEVTAPSEAYKSRLGARRAADRLIEDARTFDPDPETWTDDPVAGTSVKRARVAPRPPRPT